MFLQQRLERARRSGRSAVVVVSGEPGIGKTRLLGQFMAAQTSARILHGRGSPLGSAAPYGLIAEALESHLRTLSGERMVELTAGRELELTWVLPSVAAALGRRTAEAPGRLAVFEAVGALLVRIAGRTPAVLILDDVHDGDPSTWELVAYLGRNPLPAPVLVVMATRSAPAERGELGSLIGSLTKDGLADAIHLAPLTGDEVAELARTALGDGGADVVSLLLDRSRGNPLFATSMLAVLAEGADPASVPATVRDHVRAATGSLPAQSRGLLETAAVLGDAFELASLVALTGEETLKGLDDLIAAGLFQARGRGASSSPTRSCGKPCTRQSGQSAAGAPIAASATIRHSRWPSGRRTCCAERCRVTSRRLRWSARQPAPPSRPRRTGRVAWPWLITAGSPGMGL
jgi:predicted ATPase